MIEDENVENWYSFNELLIDPAYREWQRKLYSFIEAYNHAITYFDKLQAIRTLYKDSEREIIEFGKTDPLKYFFGGYPIDWIKFFSPIEYEAWVSIRCKGIVMYPQYPVLNYFVDFGNPTLKIAIEVDGKKYHSVMRDKARDLELLKEGWKVFRIPGAEMWKTEYITWSDVEAIEDMTEDEREGICYWLKRTGDGVIEALAHIYFWHYQKPLGFESVMHESLSSHRLIK